MFENLYLLQVKPLDLDTAVFRSTSQTQFTQILATCGHPLNSSLRLKLNDTRVSTQLEIILATSIAKLSCVASLAYSAALKSAPGKYPIRP